MCRSAVHLHRCCCVVPLLPFAQSPSHCQSSSRCCLHHGLCLCVGLVSVCWVMSSDGVRGVDDAVCVSLSTPKKRQHSTRPCLHVMVCTNASCCMVCDVYVWCGVVVWWVQEKKGRGKTQQSNKSKKDISQNHFFPFPFFFSSFSSTLFSLPSTLPPSLPSYP